MLELAVTTIDIDTRHNRAIEFVPFLGPVATAWINLTARDWEHISIQTRLEYDPNVVTTDQILGMTPTVTPPQNRYSEVEVHIPVIYS